MEVGTMARHLLTPGAHLPPPCLCACKPPAPKEPSLDRTVPDCAKGAFGASPEQWAAGVASTQAISLIGTVILAYCDGRVAERPF